MIKFYKKDELQEMSNYKLEELLMELKININTYNKEREELVEEAFKGVNEYHQLQVWYVTRDMEEAKRQVKEWNQQ